MTRLRLTPVRPKDLSAEEYARLLAARELNVGKPKDFSTMIRNIWEGRWSLYRIDGSITGVCVTNPEDGRLNIFYLHGDGLFGKMNALVARLLDIADKQGLKGLSCVTRDLRAARLFAMAKGARLEHSGAWYYLELDHGRKS
jgi:hypothetical protein